jgi:hypothetical protein
MTFLEGVEIKAICDIVRFRIDETTQLFKERGLPGPRVYTGSGDAWKRVCEDPEYAIKCGKHVAVDQWD